MKSTQDQRYIELITLLRRARISRGLSQAQLASRLGRPQSYVSKVETCERRIDYIETLEICRALGVSLCEVTPPFFVDVLQ